MKADKDTVAREIREQLKNVRTEIGYFRRFESLRLILKEIFPDEPDLDDIESAIKFVKSYLTNDDIRFNVNFVHKYTGEKFVAYSIPDKTPEQAPAGISGGTEYKKENVGKEYKKSEEEVTTGGEKNDWAIENAYDDVEEMSDSSSKNKGKRELKKFAFFPKFQETLEIIANMAEPEPWIFGTESSNQYPLLENYLCNVFDRLKYESEKLGLPDRFVKDPEGTKCVFDTGLLSRKGQKIYLLFEKNNRPMQEWFFKFVSDDIQSQNFLPFRGKLPKPADFHYESTGSVVRFKKNVAAVNTDHILLTNCERLPFSFLKTYFKGYPEPWTMKTAEDWDKFKEYISKSPFEFAQASAMLGHCITTATEKALNGDAYRVNIYHPKETGVAFFLPLYLDEPKDDCDFEVGVIINNSLTGYVVSTLFKTSMAYDKIRVMGAQKRSWLDPKRIKYWNDPYDGKEKHPKPQVDEENKRQQPQKPEPQKPEQKPEPEKPVQMQPEPVKQEAKPARPEPVQPKRNLKEMTGLSIKENYIDEFGTEGGAGDFYVVKGDRVVVGRKSNSSTADVQIPSSRYMSREHVAISKRNDGYYVEWVGSTNPAVLNGVDLKKNAAAKLHNGDVLVLGKCVAVWVAKEYDEDGSILL